MQFSFQFELDFIFSFTTCKNASLNTKVIFYGACGVKNSSMMITNAYIKLPSQSQ